MCSMTRKDKRQADVAPAADTTGSPQAGFPLRQEASAVAQGAMADETAGQAGGQAGPALRQRAEAAFREKAAQSPNSPRPSRPKQRD